MKKLEIDKFFISLTQNDILGQYSLGIIEAVKSYNQLHTEGTGHW